MPQIAEVVRRRMANARLHQTKADLEVISGKLGGRPGWFASIRPRAILKRKEWELRQVTLQGEIRLLARAAERHSIGAHLEGVNQPTPRSIAGARERCASANSEVRRFSARHPLERSARVALGDEARRLSREARQRCEEHRGQIAALQKVRGLQARLAHADSAYAMAAREARDKVAGVGINPTGTLQSVLIKAALLLIGIILTPYLIRLLFYFVLAPMAERRPAVRLPWPGDLATAPAIASVRSAISAPIRLGAGEELLVRQGYLQSTSSAGAKGTRALLDWRHPMSSLASGLLFLTCIRGEGEITTVSAVRDPFSEVGVLDLSAGATCVLQSRALVAVVQPAARPLRITSHWRFDSLHGWVTLQLRYLMFHGPARLVIRVAAASG